MHQWPPGQSAYNPVERSFHKLTKQIAGTILPHDNFGNHLRNGKTINVGLEMANFLNSMFVTCDTWQSM